MKAIVLIFLFATTLAGAADNCDIRTGESIGLPVVEFSSGNKVHSKMNLSESNADTLLEEMGNLQDMEVCSEKITSQKCILRFEKKASTNQLTMYRGADRWKSWSVNAKKEAQNFVLSLRRAGFCS